MKSSWKDWLDALVALPIGLLGVLCIKIASFITGEPDWYRVFMEALKDDE